MLGFFFLVQCETCHFPGLLVAQILKKKNNGQLKKSREIFREIKRLKETSKEKFWEIKGTLICGRKRDEGRIGV